MNYANLVLLMMQHILVAKTLLREPFQIRFNEIAYKIGRDRNYDGYPKALASMVYTFLIRQQDQE